MEGEDFEGSVFMVCQLFFLCVRIHPNHAVRKKHPLVPKQRPAARFHQFLARRFCEAEGAVEGEDFEGSVFKLSQEGRRRGYFDGSTLSGYNYGEQKLCFVNMAGIYGLSIYPELVESRGGALLGNKGMFFPNGVIGGNGIV